MTFYPPAEDSFLLTETVKKFLENKNKNISILDLGTGSGIQSKNLIELGIKKQNILAVDINPIALKQAKKLGVKTKLSNLFENIEEKFDLIIFNPPYLPEDKLDKLPDTTGGKKGDELIIKFVNQLKRHLNKNGTALLLTSSFTPNLAWKKICKKNSLKVKKLAEKKIFFEKLFVWEIIYC